MQGRPLFLIYLANRLLFWSWRCLSGDIYPEYLGDRDAEEQKSAQLRGALRLWDRFRLDCRWGDDEGFESLEFKGARRYV